eukprot:g39967.t1
MAEDALLACLAIAPATKADHEEPELSGKASRKKRGPLTGPTTSREEYVSKLAHTLIQRRERLGHRLNLVKHPNGTPLAVRPILREHETLFMPEDEEARRGIPFTQFVCDGKRFTCDDGRERKSESSTLAQDCSSSFVILRDNTYCLVHSGLQLVVSEGLVPRFLKVTSFTVEQEGFWQNVRPLYALLIDQ